MKPKTTKTNKPKAKKSSGPDLKQLLGALGQDDEWSRVWDARKAALEQLLGPSSDKVLHSLIPFEMGGFADVLVFPKFPDGVAYVTAELTCKESAQQPNQLGQYELMFCAKTAESELGGLVSRLATLTRKRKFEIGDILPSTQP